MAKETYSVGQIVLIPFKVTAVHPQGYKLGKMPNGRPRLPHGHEEMTPEELAPFEVEQPDTVVAALDVTGPTVDTTGALHFKSDLSLSGK